MVGYSNLEQQFLDTYKRLKNEYELEEYEACKKSIEECADLCNRIRNESTDLNKRRIMEDNFVKLQKLYNNVKSHLKETKTIEVTNSNARKDESPVGEPSEDGITYIFKKPNGEDLDIRNFLNPEANDNVLFKDVVGMEEEKEIISQEFFLSNEDREFKEFIEMKPKKFILLYGLPGTGKTFFAKAISNEMKNRSSDSKDFRFFSVKGGDLKSKYPGETECNISSLFEFVRQFKHCVLFIDEFDAITPTRLKDNGDPTSTSSVTSFLQELDGFSSNKNTLFLAAANCPYNIDGAVLSRASIQVEVPLPTKELISKILNRKIANFCSSEVSLDDVATRLNGYSNRDIDHFIETLKTLLFTYFKNARKNNENIDMNEFKITNEMIDKTFKKAKSSIKLDEKLKIKEYTDGLNA